MSYSYSSFGSLLSSSGMQSLNTFKNTSKYMSALKTVSTTNSYTNKNTGFDTDSIFNLSAAQGTSNYGISNTNSFSGFEKNFWTLVGSYTTPASTSSSKSSTSNTSGNNSDILSAASAGSVSDLIALLPKTSSLNTDNNNSSKLQSFFA